MQIWDILRNLYTNKSSKWINDVDEKDINPFMIQRFIALDNMSAKKASVLNKFVFTVPPKMYLSAAWSILFFNGQKLFRAPRIIYPKKQKQPKTSNYDFILDEVKEQFKLSDNDFMSIKEYLIEQIKKDKYKWFGYYGASKKNYIEHNLDFSMVKDYCKRPKFNHDKKLDSFFKGN